MAYTRPSPSAADRQFPGGSYARPAWDEADAAFGTAYPASGAAPSTTFGTPLAGYWRTVEASGFASGGCGTPALLPGFVPSMGAMTLFGAPSGSQHWDAASLGPITRIPRAYYAFDQALNATGAATTTFGTPVATTLVTSIPGQLATAAGWLSGVRGVHATAGALAASGWQTGTFGAPTASVGRLATGFAAPAIPSPAVRLTQPAGSLGSVAAFGAPLAGFLRALDASGWRTGAWGVPAAAQPHLATGLPLRTRLGAPSGSGTRTYPTYGINASGRIGTPRAVAVLGYRATGAQFVALGSPLASQRHRALHTPPGAAFGQALVQRNTAC